MESYLFTKHGKGLSFEVRDIIVEKWLEGTKPFQIEPQLNYRERQFQILSIGSYVQEAFN